jgi:uncharacterized protein
MSTEENLEKTRKAYAAFAAADLEAATADIADSIEWIVPGESSISGTYRGVDEIVGFFLKLAEKGFATEPHHFLGDGDTVVVLCTNRVGDEATEAADVVTFEDGAVVRFRSIADTLSQQRVFGTA